MGIANTITVVTPTSINDVDNNMDYAINAELDYLQNRSTAQNIKIGNYLNVLETGGNVLIYCSIIYTQYASS